MRLPRCWALLLLFLVWSSLHAQSTAPAPNAKKAPAWKDPSDGWLDLSAMLAKPGRFFPMVMPVTEPAVGYGIAGGPVFLRPQKGAGNQAYARPDISVVGGLYTSNSTWGMAVVDSSGWKGDSIETLFGAGHASVNLKYFAENAAETEFDYNLRISGGVARGKFRLGASKFYAGVKYQFYEIDASAGSGERVTVTPDGLGRTDRIAGPALSMVYDSRNTILTPTRGMYSETSWSYADRFFGGTLNFQRLDHVTIGYVPLHPRWTLGMRGDLGFSFGNPVFYARPFVTLRGVPAMRLQRQNMAQTEWELRWQFWKRFSAVGFGGVGVVWNTPSQIRRTVTTGAGGIGFRYELARKFGLHYGVDVARGPEGGAFYFVFGSAWTRP